MGGSGRKKANLSTAACISDPGAASCSKGVKAPVKVVGGRVVLQGIADVRKRVVVRVLKIGRRTRVCVRYGRERSRWGGAGARMLCGPS